MGLLDWMTSPERTQQLQGLGNNLKGAIENLKQQRGLLDAASRDSRRTGLLFPDTPAQHALDASIRNGVVNSIGPLATVWHGSPHKFDKFDSSKIGTGEGAQAYGHGLYLAESPEVAQMYKDKLTDPAFKYVSQNAAKARLHEKIAKRVEATDPQRAAALRAEVASLSDPAGSLYKVDLPDEHIAKMLDWDKPLSQQHPDVQKALEPLGYKVDTQATVAHDDALLGALFGDTSAAIPKMPQNPMGADIARGKGIFDQPQDKVIAEKLRQQGITGIRYLDGGSRGTGAGTSNFVVFPGNESLLTILERNGQPLQNLGLSR